MLFSSKAVILDETSKSTSAICMNESFYLLETSQPGSFFDISLMKFQCC